MYVYHLCIPGDLQLPRAEVFNSILPPFLVKRILRNPSHAIGDRARDPTICGCWGPLGWPGCLGGFRSSKRIAMFSRMLILLMIFVRIYCNFSRMLDIWKCKSVPMKNIQCSPKVVVQNAVNRGVNLPIRPGVDRVSILFILLCDFEKLFVANLRVNLCRLFWIAENFCMMTISCESPVKKRMWVWLFFSSFFFGRHEPFELRKHSMTMSPVKLFRFLNVALPAAKGVSDRSKEPRAKRNQFQAFFWLSSDSKCVTWSIA